MKPRTTNAASSRTYNGYGLVQSVTSWNAATGGSVVNQVVTEYNLQQLPWQEYQEHRGEVDEQTRAIPGTHN